MSQLTPFQNKILNRIFNNFGSIITITSLSTSTDKWGDATITSSTSVSTTGVPFNYITDTASYEAFGVLSENEMDMMLLHSEMIDTHDYYIVYDSNTYIVKRIEKYPFDNGNLAYAVRLVKQR